MGGREPARRRGERRGRLPQGALRPRRADRLRGRADPGRGDRPDRSDPQPGRTRARPATQRQRVRHEPRLVRADAARDRRGHRVHAPVPTPAGDRRARDGHVHVLLSAERRPRVPRDPRPGDPLDQRPLRAGDGGRVRPPEDPVLQLPDLRLLRRLLRRHGACRGLPRRRDDVREAQRRPDRAAGPRALHDDLDLPLAGRVQQGRHRVRVARLLGRRVPRGRRRRARAQCRVRTQPQAVPAGARHEGPSLLPSDRRPRARRRGAAPGAAPPADGR